MRLDVGEHVSLAFDCGWRHVMVTSEAWCCLTRANVVATIVIHPILSVHILLLVIVRHERLLSLRCLAEHVGRVRVGLSKALFHALDIIPHLLNLSHLPGGVGQ